MKTVGIRNSSTESIGATAGAADVRDRLSDVSWRPNFASGFNELVRRSDGQVLDRQPLSRRQSEQAAAWRQLERQPQQPAAAPPQTQPQEVPMQEATKITNQEQPQAYGTLKIIGPGMKPGHSKVECGCGAISEVQTYRLKSGAAKGFRHDCPLKAATNGHKSAPKAARTKAPARKAVAKAADQPASVRPMPAPVAAIEILPAPVNLERVADAIDGVTKLARLIPLEHVEAMAAEIERRAASLPPGDWGKLVRAQLDECREMAATFLIFRLAIEASEV